jgi:uncharacterized cofD-like protein
MHMASEPAALPALPALVALGGGGGVSQLLLGARPFFGARTAGIAVTDTGRSTGLARAIGAIPAPGDLRGTIAQLARDPDALLPRLLQHRFRSPELPLLDGMAFGNLLIAALAQLTGDFAAAVAEVSRLVEPDALVLPVSTANTQLCAELADATQVEGELAVRGLGKAPIRRLFLTDPRAAAHPPLLEAIAAADIVAIGPGSFFTSVLANLLFDGMAAALRATPATVVLVCNTTTQPGQTDGMNLADHVERAVELLGPGVLDLALLNRSSDTLSSYVVAQYAAEGIHVLEPDEAQLRRIADMGVTPLVRNFAEQREGKRVLWNKQDTIRHDPALLGMALWKLALDRM